MARYRSYRRKKTRKKPRNNRLLYAGIFVGLLIVYFVFLRPSGKTAEQPNNQPENNSQPYYNYDPAPNLSAETEYRPEITAPPTGPVDTTSAQLSQSEQDQANYEVTRIVNEVTAIINAQPDRIIEMRDRLNSLLAYSMSDGQRRIIKDLLARLSDKWLYSSTIYPDDKLFESYLVKSGDQLRNIAPRYKVPYEIIMQINNIQQASRLAAGATIKIPKGPFHVKVFRSTFTMDIYLQDTYVKSFSVGIGKPGRETPTGLWQVQSGGKHEKPTWQDPDTGRVYKASDPDYPLGSRWIALDGLEGQAKDRTGFAIHGTKAPEEVGKATSRGCIRLHNGNAIDVYNLLVPVLSKVTVVD